MFFMFLSKKSKICHSFVIFKEHIVQTKIQKSKAQRDSKYFVEGQVRHERPLRLKYYYTTIHFVYQLSFISRSAPRLLRK